MTERQLYASVPNGQIITFHVFDREQPVAGYLAGLDEERFFVLEPVGHGRTDFRKMFIDRRSGGSPAFEIHSDHRYRAEPCRTEMDKIISPFRQWISINVMSQRDRKPRPVRSTYRHERAAS